MNGRQENISKTLQSIKKEIWALQQLNENITNVLIKKNCFCLCDIVFSLRNLSCQWHWWEEEKQVHNFQVISYSHVIFLEVWIFRCNYVCLLWSSFLCAESIIDPICNLNTAQHSVGVSRLKHSYNGTCFNENLKGFRFSSSISSTIQPYSLHPPLFLLFQTHKKQQRAVNKLVNNGSQLIVLLKEPEAAVCTSTPPSFLTSVSVILLSIFNLLLLSLTNMIHFSFPQLHLLYSFAELGLT